MAPCATSALCIVHRALPAVPLIPVDDVPEPEGLVEDRTFLGSAACLRCRLVDAVGEAAQGKGLEPDFAGAGQRCEEDSFSAEERGFDAADELDVVLHCRLEGHETPRIHAERFAG